MTAPLGCGDVRPRLLDHQRARLSADEAREVAAHLDGCAACAHEAAADHALTDALERRMPQHAAPIALKRRLAASWPRAAHAAPPAPSADVAPAASVESSPRPALRVASSGRPSPSADAGSPVHPMPPARAPRAWWRRWPAAALAAAAVLVLAVLPVAYRSMSPAGSPLVGEAVNDHLRVLSSQNPLDVKSGGIHQVKPWFAGRLDFAPVVRFAGDEDFPLDGGAVGYFIDRKAAVFAFHRRLHAISLFVFRADGLPWPSRGLEPMGPARAYATTDRGYNVLLWREGELGYALVSDVDAGELRTLGARIAAP